MDKVYIIGDGGFAQEVKMHAERNDFQVMGLIGQKEEEDFFRLASTAHYFDKKKTKIFLGVGSPLLKNRLYNKYDQYGLFEFPNLIDKSVIYDKLIIGIGNIICPGNIITTNVKIGSFVTINLSCTIGHDVVITDFSSIMPKAAISGKVELGHSSYIGAGATILEKIVVGNYSVVGGGALVNKDVPEYTTVVGVPAVRIGVKT